MRDPRDSRADCDPTGLGAWLYSRAFPLQPGSLGRIFAPRPARPEHLLRARSASLYTLGAPAVVARSFPPTGRAEMAEAGAAAASLVITRGAYGRPSPRDVPGLFSDKLFFLSFAQGTPIASGPA